MKKDVVSTTRRSLLALPLLTIGGTAWAQEANWPSRPIRLIVSYPPGGAADVTARLVAPRMSELLGQNIVIEIRAGGSGTVGGAAVAQAPPDGYTLLCDAFSHIVNPLLLHGLAFDYATAFSAISRAAAFPQTIAVRRNSPYADMAAFVAAAKAKPGMISAGHSGNGTASHLLLERFRFTTGAALNAVPYRGGGEAARDLAGGTLESAVLAFSTAAQLEDAGQARILGVATAERVPVRPGVPTLIEAGFPGFVISDMAGFFAPAGTPLAIRTRVQSALAASLQDPGVRSRLDQMVVLPGGEPPEVFAAWVAQTRGEMAQLVKDARIKLE
jgi:tripartite-type tricarboxylate transporter receptor subunit TctC